MASDVKIRIPDLPLAQIMELATRIRPVKTGKVDPGDQLGEITCLLSWQYEPGVKKEGLKPLCDIPTLHTFGQYPRRFRPSVDEVLAQIPEQHLRRVVAFEIVSRPRTAEDLKKHPEAFESGYHVATTRLYVRE